MMTRRTIISLVLILVALVAIPVYYFLLKEKPSVTREGEITPPPATGDVDDAVDALLRELSDEGALLTEEEGDAALVTGDSGEIGGFGQTIKEDEL